MINDFKAQVASVRSQLLAGKVFQGLPQVLRNLQEAAPTEAASPVAVPTDDLHALARIQSMAARVKAESTPHVTDEELSFLLDHLGSLNPAVRDKGVFFLVSDLYQKDAFTDTQLVDWVKALQAESVMFSHILAPQNDAVFLRSFAVLLLSGAVYLDQSRHHVLQPADYEQLTLNLTAYMLLERDGRGYVDGKGWAHTYTHIGNLLDELTQVQTIARGDKYLLMAALLTGWQTTADSLVYGEDQRIAAYLVNLTNKHPFYAQSLVVLLTAWQQRLRRLTPQENVAFWNRWYNRNRLLEALLMRGDLPETVVTYLQKIIDL